MLDNYYSNQGYAGEEIYQFILKIFYYIRKNKTIYQRNSVLNQLLS